MDLVKDRYSGICQIDYGKIGIQSIKDKVHWEVVGTCH